jgi:putative oxidoreductase
VLEWLVRTHGDVVPLVLRLTLAVVMFAHGAQKVLGWFGGSGLRGTLDVLRKSGVPSSVAVLTIMAEFLGPLGLAVGLLTRVAALGIAAVMLGAILTVHRERFFMNWSGNSRPRDSSTTYWPLGLPSPSFSTVPARGRSTH